MQIKSKTVTSCISQKKKESIFCTVYFVRTRFFLYLCFISMYIVLNKLSEYLYFHVSKNITSYTFFLVFKIAERLQCILNYYFRVNFAYLMKLWPCALTRWNAGIASTLLTSFLCLVSNKREFCIIERIRFCIKCILLNR